MRQLDAIHDPVFVDKPLNPVDRLSLRFIRDRRDLPFFSLTVQIAITVVPIAVTLFFVDGVTWWLLAGLFLVLEIYFMGPFILMLHNTSHNAFFKPQYKWGNRLIPWGLCPFMGQSPDTYFSHHIGMHHAENNLELDKSSTMLYQRDSIVDFMKYFFRFLFVGIFDLLQYHRFRKKNKFFKKALIGEAAFWIACICLAWVNWQTVLLVFIAPLIIVRFLMMSGNWAQHAFIDQSAPENNYLNSITCVNSAYNKRCWNDGYHIGHHLRPHMHWTDMPNEFMSNMDQYSAQKALVFEGIDYHGIWALLMLKRYQTLANYLVNLKGTQYASASEAVELLQRRTRKFLR